MSDHHPPPPDPLVANGPTEVPLPAPAASPSAAAGPTTKRQRRPSVRLGDIGEQPAASDPYLHRRPPKHHPPSSSSVGPAIKNPNHRARVPNPDESNLETLAASIRNPNPNPNPKFPKRNRNARSSWTFSKPEEDEEGDGFRSDSDDLPSETDAGGGGGGGDWDDGNQNGDVGLDEDGGVRSWLNRLGLGRYAPVFEIHEVDDEVLPLLTLQDLKDMGINAVGSRRKMFCAIQKLQNNF